ncbi:unnamed protein product [Brassica rapa]|uniref:Uncharacterized protein n=1 Tax=Brassica campestris TaxID=3711 RepID=A0A3P6BIY3_BRACM|nr:unnamed protein product [Brassica rapa]VDC96331.1 unnamed protein product [Brassica rapa]
MSRQSQLLTLLRRRFHSPSSSDAPTETLRKRITDLQKSKKRRNPIKNQFLVEVPESRSYLDTATMPMFLAVVGIALFAKVLMMIDDSKSQEMIERKIKNAPEGQGTVRMIEREEWDEFREVRPRTPFESKLARPNAQIRTGEPVRKDDLKNWTIDVLTNALSRTEESVRRGGSS